MKVKVKITGSMPLEEFLDEWKKTGNPPTTLKKTNKKQRLK